MIMIMFVKVVGGQLMNFDEYIFIKMNQKLKSKEKFIKRNF
jgi:hypothetical protein